MLIVILNKDPFWISKLHSQQEEHQGSTGRETWDLCQVPVSFAKKKKKEVKIVVDIIAIHFREQIIA